MVSKKAGSTLDEEYRQKSSELVNFYNDNNTVITRRPPLQKWEAPIRFRDLTGIIDYTKFNGNEYALKRGIEDSRVEWILTNSDGLIASLIASHSGTTEYLNEDGVAKNSFFNPDETLKDEYIINLDNSYEIHRSNSPTIDIVFEIERKEYALTEITIYKNICHITWDKVDDRNITSKELVVGDYIDAFPAAGIFSKGPGFAKTAYTQTSFSELTVSDKFNLSDGILSIKVNDVEYSYSFGRNEFINNSYTSLIAGVDTALITDPDKLPFDAVTHDLFKPAIRIAALYSNIGETSVSLSDQYLDRAIGDWSLDEIREFVDSDIAFNGTADLTTDDPQFDVSSVEAMKDNMKRILARMLPTIEERLMPVTTVAPVEGGYKVAPDIKLGTDNTEARSICEELYTDEEIKVWSFPERNSRSYLDDSLTQAAKISKGVATAGDSKIAATLMPTEDSLEYRQEKSFESIVTDEDTGDLGFRRASGYEASNLQLGGTAYEQDIDPFRDREATTPIGPTTQNSVEVDQFISGNIIYALVPKTWWQRIPKNGGSLWRAAHQFLTSTAQILTESAGTEEENPETARLKKALKGKDPLTNQVTASWGYSIAPGTDEELSGGAGHGRYSGIGACFVALPNHPSDRIYFTGDDAVGTYKSPYLIAPFISKFRDLITGLSFGTEHIPSLPSFPTGWFQSIRKKARATAKTHFLDIILSVGYNTNLGEDFNVMAWEFNNFVAADAAALTRDIKGQDITLPNSLQNFNIASAKSFVDNVDARYCAKPRAIKFRVYYDYRHPELQSWYDSKQALNIVIGKEYVPGQDSGDALENIVLYKQPETSDVLLGRDAQNTGDIIIHSGQIQEKVLRLEVDSFNTLSTGLIMGGRGSNNLFPKAQIDSSGEDNTRPNLWHDQFLLRLFDMPIYNDLTPRLGVGFGGTEEQQQQFVGSFWYGAQPMMLPGPTYSRLSGSAIGFFPTKENKLPIKDAYFLGNMYPITNAVPASTKLVDSTLDEVDINRAFFDGSTRGHDAPMACYSTRVLNLDLNASRVDTVKSSRDAFIGEKHIFVSNHIIEGKNKLSDYKRYYWQSNGNLPSGELAIRERNIPTLDGGRYPTTAPQSLLLGEGEKVNSTVEHEGNILIATDDQVLQISGASLGPNNYPILKRIMSRGLDTNIVHESAQYYGAQGDQLISFNFYEQNQGYRGHNETKEYDPGILTQVETFIQKHNLLVAVEGGSKSIHILTFGGDRRTNGFSRFDFPFVVTGVRKLDHDRMLIFFEGERPRVLDFASRDKGIRYADYISETEFKIYKSTAATLPVVNLGADSFKSVKYSSIKNVMVYLAEQITAFTISIKSKNNIVKRQVNINDILVDANPYSAARPFLLEGMSLNTTVAPIVAIETQSDENLEFSSLVLDLKDI